METERSRRRLLWLAAYAIAMGWLEAVVVVYLRELYYPGGFRFPAAPMPPRIAFAEMTREGMTLVMILAVASLARRDRLDRFLVFGFLFGTWDLAYYAGLRILLGWPESLWSWDILFLLPVPWLSPVFYPALISVLLVAGLLVRETLIAAGRDVRLGPASWTVAVAGALTIVVSFCWRYRDVIEQKVPQDFPAVIFWAGLLVAVAPFARAAVVARLRD